MSPPTSRARRRSPSGHPARGRKPEGAARTGARRPPRNMGHGEMRDIAIFICGMVSGGTIATLIMAMLAIHKQHEREHDLDERMGEE